MRRRLPWLLVPLLLLIPLLLPATVRADSASYDQAVDTLFSQTWPQDLETYFTSLGTNPDLGFRWAGTTAERAVGCRVAKEMRTMGLRHVRFEPVPVDVFEFKCANVTVGDRVMTASTVGGVPPTPRHGITADVVYVKGGTAADFDAAGDVKGKIVLMDKMMSSWWYNMPAFEAALRKAAAVICTFTPDDPKYYSVNDQALGSFDGYYDLCAPPWVYIAWRDGDWLKAQLKSGPVKATVVLKEKVTLQKHGGVAYNVVGELPGCVRDGQMVLMAAHQDAHFRAGLDDTAALVNMLTVAKAMRMSDYHPQHTVVFLATVGEEFAYTNAYYEWCIGAWWAATHTHRDWAGRVRAMLNLELMGLKDAPLALQCNPELKPWLEKLISDNPTLLPYSSEVLTPVYSWNDQWTFTATGIPSVEFATSNDDYSKLYHTNFETSALVDWPYLATIAKFIYRAQQSIDGGLLPYGLQVRADDLAATVSKDQLVAAGADAAVVDRLVADVAAFQTAAAAYDAGVGAIPAEKVRTVNRQLLAIEKLINHNFTALTPWDATIYPHQQVLGDTEGINAALTALRLATPDKAAALTALGGTYMTWYGINFSYPVFLKEISRHDPDYYRINWGGQGQLPEPLDVMPQYRMIEAGDYSGAIAGLEKKRSFQLCQLNKRLASMACVVEKVTPKTEAITY